MKVVKLLDCRDLLAALDRARAAILRGDTQGMAICRTDAAGVQTVEFSGSYMSDRSLALKASLRMSWELTKGRDFEDSCM